MHRRSLLRIGIASGAVLLAVGTGVALWRPGVRDGRLSESGRRVFRGVAVAVLDGALESQAEQREIALRALLDRLDATILALPHHARTELSRLLGLLDTAAGRLAIAGLRADWDDASVSEIQTALQEMRMSSFSLRQQAYHALRDLTGAAFYSDSSTWHRLGYPGPMPV